MKTVLWVFGSLASLLLLLYIVETMAAERIEVVELYTLDQQGQQEVTRLWVVDDEGFQYLRVGASGSGWFTRIQENKTVEVRRNEVTSSYTVVQRPDKSERINRLMQEKYTWGDSFIGALFGGRGGSTPLELHPVS